MGNPPSLRICIGNGLQDRRKGGFDLPSSLARQRKAILCR